MALTWVRLSPIYFESAQLDNDQPAFKIHRHHGLWHAQKRGAGRSESFYSLQQAQNWAEDNQ